MQIQRRSFLGTMGVGALAASLEAQAAATADANANANAKWDMTWAERVNRQHRAVFDSPDFSDGAGLIRAVNWKNEYQEVYGTAPEDMSAVLVVRGSGIWLAMNDAFWTTYNIGEKKNFKDGATGKFLATNPIASASSAKSPKFADMNVPQFLSSGNVVLACHRAFGGVVAHLKKTDKIATDEEAENKAVGFLLPGVILQPSGVFAVLRAQEAGCHYIMAS